MEGVVDGPSSLFRLRPRLTARRVSSSGLKQESRAVARGCANRARGEVEVGDRVLRHREYILTHSVAASVLFFFCRGCTSTLYS